jgi:hypothetical protein
MIDAVAAVSALIVMTRGKAYVDQDVVEFCWNIAQTVFQKTNSRLMVLIN